MFIWQRIHSNRDKMKYYYHHYYLLIIPIAILALLAWLVWKNLPNFENEINIDGHNGSCEKSEFYDDNLD